jgi:hypothetical protein
MPRMTKAQIGLLLADADAAARDFRKAAKRNDELKAAVRALNLKPGTYGDVTFAEGTPREILDQPAAKDALTRAGLPIPTVMTQPPLIIKPVVK